METTHFAVDTSKSVFTLHASDPTGRCTYRRDLSRGKFLAWFAKLAPVTVTLEACGGSHHWGRELAKLGHTVRLIAHSMPSPLSNVARTIAPMPKRSAKPPAAPACASCR